MKCKANYSMFIPCIPDMFRYIIDEKARYEKFGDKYHLYNADRVEDLLRRTLKWKAYNE